MAATIAPAPRPKAPEKPAAPAAAPPTRVPPPPTRPSMLQTAAPATRLGGETASAAESTVPGVSTGGEPLPAAIQAALEKSLRVNLQAVRVHTDAHAHRLAERLSARAVTYGNHIFLGAGEQATDLGLIGHEVAHVVQQQGAPTPQRMAAGQGDRYEQEAHRASAAVAHQEPFTVQERTTRPRVQRLGISDALDYFADAANAIPGFRMFTIILGVNPINMSRVERSAANIMRALVEFLPGGGLITEALDNYGIFDRVGAWVEQQIRSLGMTGSLIKQAIDEFLDSLSWSDIFDLDDVWERAKRIFTTPIDRIIDFATGLVTDIINFIKDAILMPLAELAAGTPGWDLLIAVLGKNPITGEAVPRTADTLIGGFMKLIGQEEVWNNLKRANAVARAWAWFQGALEGLLGFVRQIPALFMQALQALQLMDIVLLPQAFVKVGKVFAGFFGQFVSWAGGVVWNLLEIIFDVVSPGALGYIKKTGAALKSILKNPLPFVGNLVKAAKLGFQNFSSNFGTHLKAGLIDWLTGSLPGVYIPKAFLLAELVKFVFSVLGLTWQNVRQKLVKVVGEPAVKAMEVGFDIVVTLVKQGPAAAWDKIKDQLANLRDMVIGGIIDFVVDMVVTKAVPKLVALFIPGAGFISAILTIYDTVMVFVNKISKIIQVVTGFINSIVAIAAGAIGTAAKRVETTLAGLLALAINFLAGFAGVGRVADKVMGVINKVRAPIDKALDWLINWIVTMAKKLFAKAFGKADEPDGEKQKKIDAGIKVLRNEESKRSKAGKLAFLVARQIAALIKSKHPVFQTFEAFEVGTRLKYRYTASPTRVIEGPEELPKHDVDESAIEAPETEPSGNSWEMTIFANITDTTGKHRFIWVMIAVPMDPDLKIPTQPPKPNMLIEGRVTIDGEKKQLRLNGGSITEYALKLIISRYEKRFGDLTEIHGSLAADNKSLYQIAYADLRSQNVDEDDAKLQAILKTPFGKYRARLKYDKFEITLKSFEWAIIPKLDPEKKKRFFVPTSIDVIARR